MNITSKSRYAIKVMMDLIYHRDLPHVNRKDIAQRQGVPREYLDHILVRLRRGGLIESVRGRGGGYRLAKPPEQITVWDLLNASEDNLYAVTCLDEQVGSCEYEVSCISRDAWQTIFGSVRQTLSQMNLQQMVNGWAARHHMCPVGGVKECRSH